MAASSMIPAPVCCGRCGSEFRVVCENGHSAADAPLVGESAPPDPAPADTGKRTLRELREAAGYASQGEAAAALGVNQTDLSRWERGDAPRAKNRARLAAFYGVEVDAIAWGVR